MVHPTWLVAGEAEPKRSRDLVAILGCVMHLKVIKISLVRNVFQLQLDQLPHPTHTLKVHLYHQPSEDLSLLPLKLVALVINHHLQ